MDLGNILNEKDRKRQIWYDSSYMRYLVKLRGKVEGWLPGIRRREDGELLLNGGRVSVF